MLVLLILLARFVKNSNNYCIVFIHWNWILVINWHWYTFSLLLLFLGVYIKVKFVVIKDSWLCFYQTRSAWSVDQGSNKNHSPAYNFAPTVTKFCVMWEGLSLPHDTKFGNCRCKIVDSRAFPSWSLIHGLCWSGLIKAEPGPVSGMVNFLRSEQNGLCFADNVFESLLLK